MNETKGYRFPATQKVLDRLMTVSDSDALVSPGDFPGRPGQRILGTLTLEECRIQWLIKSLEVEMKTLGEAATTAIRLRGVDDSYAEITALDEVHAQIDFLTRVLWMEIRSRLTAEGVVFFDKEGPCFGLTGNFEIVWLDREAESNPFQRLRDMIEGMSR